jgi:6-phospho-3-hexuloisomerase
MTKNIVLVLDELAEVFQRTNFAGESLVLEEIVTAKKIICAGAGRVGLAVAGFAKRLRHLGKEAFWIEDVTLPHTGSGDVMFVASGSGETRTVVTLARIAKENGLKVVLLTASPESTLSQIADAKITLNCPSKLDLTRQIESKQPMTTLFEQSCQLYLDSLVLDLMEITNTTDQDMARRHNAIE